MNSMLLLSTKEPVATFFNYKKLLCKTYFQIKSVIRSRPWKIVTRSGRVGSIRGTAGKVDQGLAGPGQQQLVPAQYRESIRGTAGRLDQGLAGPAKGGVSGDSKQGSNDKSGRFIQSKLGIF